MNKLQISWRTCFDILAQVLNQKNEDRSNSLVIKSKITESNSASIIFP